jgi:hypothetical protein
MARARGVHWRSSWPGAGPGPELPTSTGEWSALALLNRKHGRSINNKNKKKILLQKLSRK